MASGLIEGKNLLMSNSHNFNETLVKFPGTMPAKTERSSQQGGIY